jgi:hypothetical protein
MIKKGAEFKARLKEYFLRNQFAIRYGWIFLRMVWSLVRVTLVLKVLTHQSDSAYFNALFIDMGTSYVPYEDPQIVVTVLVEAGGGGDVAAVPIAKQVLQWWSENRFNK